MEDAFQECSENNLLDSSQHKTVLFTSQELVSADKDKDRLNMKKTNADELNFSNC